MMRCCHAHVNFKKKIFYHLFTTHAPLFVPVGLLAGVRCSIHVLTPAVFSSREWQVAVHVADNKQRNTFEIDQNIALCLMLIGYSSFI